MGVSQYVKQELARLQEENELLREEVIVLRSYIDSIQALMDAVDAMDPTSEIMPLLERILYSARSVISAQEGSLLVLDDESAELVFVQVSGPSNKELVGKRMPADKGIAGWVVQNKKPTIVNNARADDRFYARIDQSLNFVTKSILAAPIVGRGRILGVIEVLNKLNGQPFNETDQVLLTLLCRFAGDFLHYMLEQGEEPETPSQDTSDQAPTG
nr:GAF domain-containing protein [Anaerolineae bacterium]